MNTRILLLVVSLAAFSSCSTLYKSGQTPDDVYYSPARSIPNVNEDEYVRVEKADDEYNSDYVNTNDRYLRMKSLNRNRWSSFDDDYYYWNDSRWNNQLYYSNINLYNRWNWNPYFNTYSYWNNPFCPVYYGQPIVIVNPKPINKNPIANGPRVYNLNTNNNNNNGSYNPKRGWMNSNNSGNGSPIRVFGNNNSGSSNNGRNFNNSNNNSRSNSSGNSNPVRTFEPRNNSSGSSGNSGSKSSGSSGSSGGSAPVRTFPKSGGGQ